jgi:hypothetical protein
MSSGKTDNATAAAASTQASTEKKAKHGHAASQAQSAPRKVRFNVGEERVRLVPRHGG